MTEAIFTAEQLAEIHAYHQPYYVWDRVDDLATLAVALLLLRFVVRPLYATCARLKPRLPLLERVWKGDEWAAALVFAVTYLAISTLIFLPADVWFGFIHEHRFGLVRMSAGTFAFDYLKAWAVTALGYGALAFGLFGLARRLKGWWAVLGTVGAVVLLFSAALDPYRARVFYDQTPLAPGELRERITALMAKANIDFRDVLVEQTSAKSVRAQAYFAGRGPTRTIVLNDSLLKELNTEEILAVVAHEAGHVSESRWPATIASAIALFAFLFGVDRLLRWVARRGLWGVTQPADIRALPLVLFVFATSAMIVKPVSAAFSRAREREADLYGLRLTSNPEAFARMLVKLARVNKMDPDPPLWVTLKKRTHPSIRERLESIERGDWKKTGGG